MLASVPIAHAAELLQDVGEGLGGVTWTPAQLLGWWNEAQRVIAGIKPQASVTTTNLVLTPNAVVHPLASGQNAVIDIICNMGTGAVPGATIRMMKDRQAIEDTTTDWHSMTGEAAIKSYYYDIRNPKYLWTYPRAHASTVVAIKGVFSVTPTNVTAATDAITIAEEYEPAGVNWMVFRCLARDSRSSPNWNRAMGNLQIFSTLLGLEVKGDVLNDPRIAEHLTGPGAAAMQGAS